MSQCPLCAQTHLCQKSHSLQCKEEKEAHVGYRITRKRLILQPEVLNMHPKASEEVWVEVDPGSFHSPQEWTALSRHRHRRQCPDWHWYYHLLTTGLYPQSMNSFPFSKQWKDVKVRLKQLSLLHSCCSAWESQRLGKVRSLWEQCATPQLWSGLLCLKVTVIKHCD